MTKCEGRMTVEGALREFTLHMVLAITTSHTSSFALRLLSFDFAKPLE